MLEITWQPTARHLRQFAACLVVLLLASAWTMRDWQWPLLIGALVVSLLGWLVPRVLTVVYVPLMLVTFPIGLVVGELALLVIYCGVFLPIGLLFRMLGRDALRRKLERDAVSYWETREPEPSKRSYLRRY